jgi:hypothetical protein
VALETATGLVKAGHYKRRRRREFLDFMNGIIDTYGKEKEIFGSSQRLPPGRASSAAHEKENQQEPLPGKAEHDQNH